AMNTAANIFEQPITERPEIPARFGEDGGKFYYYYDQLADELDDDLTKRLKSQLDSLLIFAGLFAGVNSAFLALTLPMMNADPADDTNALLLQLVKGGNATINSEADLPSATFSPLPAIYPVNVLFAVSLTCALMSSFLAVLGQQWLVYCRKRSGGGAEHQRKEQLRRQLGAQRWRLELVLDDILPSLLQAGLFIFCISFILYLSTLSGSMSSIVSAIVGTALAIIVVAAVCATWDRMCPYQSPLSHLLCWTMDQMEQVAVVFVWFFVLFKAYLHQILPIWARGTKRQMEAAESSSVSTTSSQSDKWKAKKWTSARQITSRALMSVGRREESTNDLLVASVKRVILTSEHTAALIHAATNICAIDDEDSLRDLLHDTELFDRLHNLFSTYNLSLDTSPVQLRTIPAAMAKSCAAAILHLALSVGTIMNLVAPKDRPLAVKQSPHARPRVTVYQIGYLWSLAANVQLESHLWDGDLKHASYLRLLGMLLEALFFRLTLDSWRYYLRDTIENLSNFTTSYQLLCTLACAVKLYIISCEMHPDEEGVLDRRISQLFGSVKTAYADGKDLANVPFLLEALQLDFESWGGKNGDRSEAYKICLTLFRCACELDGVKLTGVFASMGRMLQGVELDIRRPVILRPEQDQLRRYKHQYIEIIVRTYDNDPNL
ncbi:hypothetical protein FRC01_005065, partial [Tulasnella sp. 417]